MTVIKIVSICSISTNDLQHNAFRLNVLKSRKLRKMQFTYAQLMIVCHLGFGLRVR